MERPGPRDRSCLRRLLTPPPLQSILGAKSLPPRQSPSASGLQSEAVAVVRPERFSVFQKFDCVEIVTVLFFWGFFVDFFFYLNDS